jgi:hypothetical protein
MFWGSSAHAAESRLTACFSAFDDTDLTIIHDKASGDEESGDKKEGEEEPDCE